MVALIRLGSVSMVASSLRNGQRMQNSHLNIGSVGKLEAYPTRTTTA
jgi:hypothetical protein